MTLVDAERGLHLPVDEGRLVYQRPQRRPRRRPRDEESRESRPAPRCEGEKRDPPDRRGNERTARRGQVHDRSESRERQCGQDARDSRASGSHDREQQRVGERHLDPEPVPVPEREAETGPERRHVLETLLRAERAGEQPADERDHRDCRDGERDPADDPRRGHQTCQHDRDREHGDIERDLVELLECAFRVRRPADRDQDPDGERGEEPQRGEGEPIDPCAGRGDPDRGTCSEQPPGRHARVRSRRRKEAAFGVGKGEHGRRDRDSDGGGTRNDTLLGLYVRQRHRSLHYRPCSGG